MLGSDSSNPTGHYEDLEFLAINKAILRVAGGSWRSPTSHEAIMAVHTYDARMAALVAKRDAEHELWGWKDPRTCLTLEKWMPLLSHPFVAYIHRDHRSVMDSLWRRNHIGLSEGIPLCGEYERRLEGIHFDWFGDYEVMVNYPEDSVQALAAALDLEPSPAAVAFINPSLDHSWVATCV